MPRSKRKRRGLKWQRWLDKQPEMDRTGRVIHASKDAAYASAARERHEAKVTDWFAPRGKRHP